MHGICLLVVRKVLLSLYQFISEEAGLNTQIVVQFEGLQADEGHLNLYDAAESIRGLATSINIVTHAFVHENEIRTRVPLQNEFNTYLTGAKKGCFELSIGVAFGGVPQNYHGRSVIISRYWDYMLLTMATAVGEVYEPLTPYVQSLEVERPEIFDELSQSIENHLEEVHRPIKMRNAEVAKIVRPHVGEKIVFNQTTYQYLHVAEKSDEVERLVGNVTRYNILSGYGRAFINDMGRTVPFVIKDIEGEGRVAHLQATASMDEAARRGVGIGGQRLFDLYRTTGSRDQVKRIHVININYLEN